MREEPMENPLKALEEKVDHLKADLKREILTEVYEELNKLSAARLKALAEEKLEAHPQRIPAGGN
jgi:hypothetical protein